MDFRKLIKFGNSSHVISIPKTWINKNNLNKGDVIYFSENDNNELIISARENNETSNERSVVINLEGKSLNEVKRLFYSKYLAGYDEITLFGEKEIRENENDLRNAINDTIALEITEQTKNKLVARDFIDSRAISIESTLKRIDILIRSMMEDLKTTYKDDINNLSRRDREINKLSNLILRTIKKSAENPHLQKKIGIKQGDTLIIWNMVQSLELFADELKRAARHLGKSKVKESLKKEFIKTHEKIEEDYKTTMKAWYSKDENLAYKIAENIKKVIKMCEKLDKQNKDNEFSLAIGKLKSMETFIKKMARSVYE